MRLIEKVWFNRTSFKWLLVPALLPFSLLFWLLSALRRLGYRLGAANQQQIAVPVIVVGNISVGGNGKTPMVVYLVELCRQIGLKPGVISRGYGGEADQYPLILNASTSSAEAGDEPVMIYRRTKAPVVVGPERVKSARELVGLGCDVIISDDGLQHYALARQLEFIVVDSKRQFGNGLLMPAGPLREGKWRLNTADFIIANGINPLPALPQAKTMQLSATGFYQLTTGKYLSVDEFIALYPKVNAFAGIGDPSRFFSTLTDMGLIIEKSQSFVDHHQYQANDLALFSNEYPVLMTEKDAVKCDGFAPEHAWYLAVDAKFEQEATASVIDKLRRLV